MVDVDDLISQRSDIQLLPNIDLPIQQGYVAWMNWITVLGFKENYQVFP